MADDPTPDSSEAEALEARLSEFDAKVRRAGASRMPEPPEWNYPGRRRDVDAGIDVRGLGIGMTAAYSLVGGLAFGALAGWLAERFLRAGSAAIAIGAVIGTVLGLVSVFVLVSRELRRP